ncbi:hypothetical protein [Mobilicoccus caccae]|uniref:Uncharacterized protein n=1 Tax=Mobilicoccus caccae TaxID=1859295 RepID=A0ABQ6IQM4_9MICO|nr:hypothetical protein [Mobilicoccus caccae]GMA40210.1 hypothetical protein GCM10025883_22550 [Mobilicoccus caccae]
MAKDAEQQRKSREIAVTRAGVVSIPALASLATGVGTYLYGWQQPAEVLGAVSAAGTVAAAVGALWIAVTDMQRRERDDAERKRLSQDAEAQRAAVVVVRTRTRAPWDEQPGTIRPVVTNFGERAVLDVYVQAVWCLEPPRWHEPYALVFHDAPVPRIHEDVLRPDETLGTGVDTVTAAGPTLGALRADFAGVPPAQGPPKSEPFGTVVSVVRWRERSGTRWERVEDGLPRRLDEDGPTPLPDGAVVLWDRDDSMNREKYLKSVRTTS